MKFLSRKTETSNFEKYFFYSVLQIALQNSMLGSDQASIVAVHALPVRLYTIRDKLWSVVIL